MSKLKPCPFCGKQPYIKHLFDDVIWVECRNSDCQVIPTTRHKKTKKEAIEAWNRRAET